MSQRYDDLIKIIQTGPIDNPTVEIQSMTELRSVAMPEATWKKIVADWAAYYASLDRD